MAWFQICFFCFCAPDCRTGYLLCVDISVLRRYLCETESASQRPLPSLTLACTQAVCLCAFLPNTLYRVSICQHRQKDDTSVTQCKSKSGRMSCHTACIWQTATCRKRPTSISTQSSTKCSQLDEHGSEIHFKTTLETITNHSNYSVQMTPCSHIPELPPRFQF